MIDYNAYSKMLTTQVDMCFPFEYSFYKEINFEGAKNIVEIGCGNGSFLKMLKQYFPSKNYYGYDHSEELIRLAGSEDGQIVFQVGSAHSLNEQCELVILRLIVHQLADRKRFLSELSERLVGGGRVIMVEPFDEKFQLSPNLPAFSDHLKKHREALSPNTASRNLKKIIVKEMSELGFQLNNESYYYVPSLLPGYKEKYYEYMIATSKIIGCDQKVLDDIKGWYQLPDSFVQIGLFMNCYTKVASEKA